MPPKTQHYIAFSIHGTNAFIIATRELSKKESTDLLASGEYKVATSRLAKPKVPGSVKLTWSGLTNKATGQPLKSPPVIIARFKKLEALGWTVDKIKFVEKHFRGKHTRSVSR